MDEKTQSEARRKKILENAEARLRFIKEGIPWRNIEEHNSEVTQPDDKLKKNEDTSFKKEDSELLGNCIEGGLESQTSTNIVNNVNDKPVQSRLDNDVDEFKNSNTSNASDKLGGSDTFIKEEGKSLNVVDEISNSENIDESSQESSVQPSTENIDQSSVNPPLKSDDSQTVSNKPEEDRNDLETNSDDVELITDYIEVDSNDTEFLTNVNRVRSFGRQVNSNFQNFQGRSNNPGIIPDELFRTLKTLLTESSNEREEHKRRARELNVNIWISLFIMLCLGIFTRISYAVGLSWLFKEVMLVPFMTAAVPRLIPMIRNPPAPTGPLVQFLLMAGVKLKFLKRVFTMLTVLRMFLQLFSVYLISFVFTHQIAESFFA